MKEVEEIFSSKLNGSRIQILQKFTKKTKEKAQNAKDEKRLVSLMRGQRV